jgi:hypothetical protein
MSNTIVVAGALANKTGSGGEAWVRLSWIRGFEQLGYDVWFIEQIEAVAPEQLRYFDAVTAAFGLTRRSALILGDEVIRGPDRDALVGIVAGATLVNISGHLDLPRLFAQFGQRIYIDIDPGFTQSWFADGISGSKLAGHDQHFTIAEGIGRSDCPIPSCGITWKTVRQPVVLADWPLTGRAPDRGFTTVGSWRGPYGPVTLEGRTYGLKVHEFRRIVTLPTVSTHRFELALDIHDADRADRDQLVANNWHLVDPRSAASDPQAFRRYVQTSAAEFSVAQGVYVGTNSGWFSDRTVRYLASGKPALVQDTGFSRTLPTGVGLVSFDSLQDAVSGADEIMTNYADHSAAARQIAVEHFDAGRVLTTFCDQADIS